LDIDPRSPTRGTRLPLWLDFHAPSDAYRPGNLLVLMPVPGHVLETGTLYAAVVTDDVRDASAAPVAVAPAIARPAAGTPTNAFEIAALPLCQPLWRQLEQQEGLARTHVVTATVFRTGTPAEGLAAAARVVRRRPRPDAAGIVELGFTTPYCHLVGGSVSL